MASLKKHIFYVLNVGGLWIFTSYENFQDMKKKKSITTFELDYYDTFPQLALYTIQMTQRRHYSKLVDIHVSIRTISVSAHNFYKIMFEL